MICKCASPIPNYVRIIFELPASLWADGIALVAEFNDWNPDTTPFHQERDGIWRTRVDLPICRRFEFRYLVDGDWVTDIHADDVVPNNYGSFNSVVHTVPPVVQPDRSLGHGMIQESMTAQPGRPARPHKANSTLRILTVRQPNLPIRRINFCRHPHRHWRRCKHHSTAIVVGRTVDPTSTSAVQKTAVAHSPDWKWRQPLWLPPISTVTRKVH